MTTDDDFLRAITARPADNQVRLAYADWLEGQGDPAIERLAEFIRASVAHAEAWTASGHRRKNVTISRPVRHSDLAARVVYRPDGTRNTERDGEVWARRLVGDLGPGTDPRWYRPTAWDRGLPGLLWVRSVAAWERIAVSGVLKRLPLARIQVTNRQAQSVSVAELRLRGYEGAWPAYCWRPSPGTRLQDPAALPGAAWNLLPVGVLYRDRLAARNAMAAVFLDAGRIAVGLPPRHTTRHYTKGSLPSPLDRYRGRVRDRQASH